MVPSYFIVMDQFPLNSNGKVDRKQLPVPTLIHDTSSTFVPIEDQSTSDLEAQVRQLWCSTLRLENISRDMNCFSLGGSSLSIMQFFNHYQFHLVPGKQIDILDFFVNPTIANHVQLLMKSKSQTKTLLNSLHLEQGMSLLRNKLMLNYFTFYRRGFICSAPYLDG